MKRYLIILIILLICSTAKAQKADSNRISKEHDLSEVAIKSKKAALPDVQQISLRLPDSLKVGKSMPWKNQFHADNHETNILYTMANDDKYLYFIARASDVNTIRNIFGSGLALAFNKTDRKNAKDSISITYPVTEIKRELLFKYLPDGDKTPIKEADSVMRANNLTLELYCKDIALKGIVGLDHLLSVYNSDDIRVSSRFNNKMQFTYELRVPLTYLGLSIKGTDNFTYHVEIKGIKRKASSEFRDWVLKANKQWYINTSPTNFWGIYTLAKN